MPRAGGELLPFRTSCDVGINDYPGNALSDNSRYNGLSHSVSPLTCHATLAAYAVVILIGISGNLLVLAAVSGRKKMHTAHNFFIAALACSDLFLCSWSVKATNLQTSFEIVI